MTFEHFINLSDVLKNRIHRIESLIDGTRQLQLGFSVLGFENALNTVKMINDQIQCRSWSLLNLSRTEYT